jgi:DNA-binding NtrC family response regulator
MEQIEKRRHDAWEPGTGSFLSNVIQTTLLDRVQPPASRHPGTSPDPEKILAQALQSVIDSYLGACADGRDVPLKEFMNDLEKKILLACLHLTRGSQRDAADLLGLRPTALFEKMRKHYINGRRIKLLGKLTNGGQHAFA